MIEGYRINITMFGMNDPAQTLMQLESYIKDGRFEMSEVMATQFTEMFLSNKKRTSQEQIMLVRGLQILCDVLTLRQKYSLAVTAAKTLLRERKKVTQGSSNIGLIHTDLHRCAKSLALAGKRRKAKAYFTKANNSSNGCVAAASDGVRFISSDKKMITTFITALQNSGPVTKSGQLFLVAPSNLIPVDANEILLLLSGSQFENNPQALEQASRISREIEMIKKGEMAANAKLQSALDSLKPKHDYYEYS
jgi:hypothetical protein|tara:strand:- start:59 stop:808 length:750 start_codon:yes stop_codon:yes gene_type:complete